MVYWTARSCSLFDHAPVDEDAKLLPFGQSEIGATAWSIVAINFKMGNEMRLPLLKVLAKIHQIRQILRN
jgi:hypothetical protein